MFTDCCLFLSYYLFLIPFRFIPSCHNELSPPPARFMLKSNLLLTPLIVIEVMKNLNVAVAALAGLALGAAAGLLFAPKKGEDLREDICEYLRSKGIRLKKDRLDELVEEIAAEAKK